MKKLIGIFVALLVTAPAAYGGGAETSCISFDNFCDGIEITSDGMTISGVWENNDCAGTNSAFSGVGFNGPGQARFFCTDALCPIGLDFLFQADMPNGLFNLFGFDGANVTVFQVNQPFTLSAGACPFAGDVRGGVPSSLR